MWGLNLLKPKWDLPSGVHAVVSTREGGVSDGKYGNFNMSTNVGDDADAVGENRMRLQVALANSPDIAWIKQEHSNKVLLASEIITSQEEKICDAVYSENKNEACVVCTADCIPILFASLNDDKKIAAVHVGWRGLCNNIISNVAEIFNNANYTAYIGPCISQDNYPVAKDTYDELINAGASEEHIKQKEDKYFIDLAQIAKAQLIKYGAKDIAMANLCTFEQRKLFYSARRDGINSGRFATLIWRS